MALMTYLALFALVWWSFLWLLSLLGWSIAKRRYTSLPSSSQYDPSNISVPQDQIPGVTILRPLRGLDSNLYENLESSFQQRYPTDKFEIVFSVAEEDDQAIPLVRNLIDQYPHVNASLIIGDEKIGINPKINNLVRSYRAAKYDILWVLDSNVQVSIHALGRAISAFSPSPPQKREIGLVHHVPFPVFPDINLGSRVEQAFLSTTHAKMYLAINRTGVDSCVCGKSTLFRKSVLEKATKKHEERTKGKSTLKGASQSLSEQDRYGIAAFSEYLGEDNMIGRFIWHELGMRHAMAPDVAANVVGNMSFDKYFWRRVRWLRVRKYMVVASTLIEPITESFLCGLLGAFALSYFFGFPSYITFPLHIAFWFMLDVSIFRSLTQVSPAQSIHNPKHDGPGATGFRPAFLFAWLTREMSALPIWLFAMLGNKVSWREDGKIYKVRTDGKAEQLPASEGKDYIDRLGESLFRRAGGRSAGQYGRIGLGDEERT